MDKSTRIFPIIVQKPHLLLSIWLACVRLYHVLYENVNESIYLMRKHTRFKQIAETFESSLSQELCALKSDELKMAKQIAEAERLMWDRVPISCTGDADQRIEKYLQREHN